MAARNNLGFLTCYSILRFEYGLGLHTVPPPESPSLGFRLRITPSSDFPGIKNQEVAWIAEQMIDVPMNEQ